MAKHIFLTGEKQVGKSTLIQNILKNYKEKVGGFFTVRTDRFRKEEFSVHLYHVDEPPIPAQENLLFICQKADCHTPVRFDLLGCRALEKSGNCSLLVMDELGSHETDAKHFRKKVLEQLQKDTPVLGVLRAPADEYWPEITNHPDVTVIEIRTENRDSDEIMDLIRANIYREI